MPYTRSTWVNNSAPDINATNLNNIELGIVAAPYGPDASANFVPIWNGSAWTYTGVKNAHVDAAAAIAYSKLNLATSIVNGDISGSAAIAYSKLNLATSILNADVATGAAIAVSKLAAGTNGQVLQTTAGVPTWGAAAGQTFYRKTTAKTVNTTVAATDLLNAEITIAANAMGATSRARLTAQGDFLNNVGNPGGPRFQVKLGSATLFDTGAPPSSADFTQDASRRGWKIVVEIQNTATNAQSASILGSVALVPNTSYQQGFTTGEGYQGNSNATGMGFAGWNSSAVDMTASQALVLNVIHFSSSASVEIVLKDAIVEIF